MCIRSASACLVAFANPINNAANDRKFCGCVSLYNILDIKTSTSEIFDLRFRLLKPYSKGKIYESVDGSVDNDSRVDNDSIENCADLIKPGASGLTLL